MAASTSPLQVVANALTPPAVSSVVTIGASTAMLGVLLSQILGISRMMLAMGRRNDLPPFFQKIHGRYKVPHLGILFTGLLILLLAQRRQSLAKIRALASRWSTGLHVASIRRGPRKIYGKGLHHICTISILVARFKKITYKLDRVREKKGRQPYPPR